MARGQRARPAEDQAEEIKTKDFDLAVKLYRGDIAPAVSRAAEAMQEASTAYKAIKKQAHLQPDAARKAFKLMEDTEDAKRDDWLRCFVGLVNELGGRTVLTFHSNDLFDLPDQQPKPDKYARPKPTLVTAGPPSDGTETDLADAAEGDPKDGSDGDDGAITPELRKASIDSIGSLA